MDISNCLIVLIIFQSYYPHNKNWVRKHRTQNRKHRTQNRERRTENREHRTENTEQRTEDREHRTENTEHRTLNREQRTHDREHGTENTEHRTNYLGFSEGILIWKNIYPYFWRYFLKFCCMRKVFFGILQV